MFNLLYRMKKNYIQSITLLCFLAIALCSFSQAPAYSWMNKVGTLDYEFNNAVCVDGSANVITAGTFTSSSLTIGSSVLTNAGNKDVFVAKYDASGTPLWAIRIGNALDEYDPLVATDASGNIYVAGNYESSNLILGTTTLINSSMPTSDFFLVKLNASGTVIWAKTAGGTAQDFIKSLVVKGSNVFLAGDFVSSSFTIGTTTLSNNSPFGTSDIVLARFTTSGSFGWAKKIGGSLLDNVNDVAASSTEVSITGYFESSDFAYGSPFTFDSPFGYDCFFVVTYSTAGVYMRAESYAGSGGDSYGTALKYDSNDKLYVAGKFTTTEMPFGAYVLPNLSTMGGATAFVAKYNPSTFSYLWAQSISSGGSEDLTDIDADTSGVYVVGSTYGDSLVVGADVFPNEGSSDGYVAKFSSWGTPAWAKVAAGADADYLYGVAVDKYKNVFISGGSLSSFIAFDSYVFNNSGGSDGFLAKIGNFNPATALEEPNAEAETFVVYPNPFKTETVLRFQSTLDNAVVAVFDMLGKKVMESTFSGQEFILHIENLSSGVYQLRVSAQNYQVGKKIVVQ